MFKVGDRVKIKLGLREYVYSWTGDMSTAFNTDPVGVVSEVDGTELVRVYPQSSTPPNRWSFNFHSRELIPYTLSKDNEPGNFPKLEQKRKL